MDPALEGAAQALSRFDPLEALSWVALRDEPEALALRGIAMAQLGDFPVARRLLGRAAGLLGRTDRRARARCLAALGEVALASRDLSAARATLEEAIRELEAADDARNALFVRLQLVRCLVLVGALGEARDALLAVDLRAAPPALRALGELVVADIALRNLEARSASAALARAAKAARAAKIVSLTEEIERATAALNAPVARVSQGGAPRPATLAEIEALMQSGDLVIDACRRTIRAGSIMVPLVTRPVLLALAVCLGAAAGGEATREALAEHAFGTRRMTDSIRVRLRVEVGRLRKLLAPVAELTATTEGYRIAARRRRRMVVVLPPAPGEESAVLALLRAGESWSTSALATAMGSSQRSVQRALALLHAAGQVEGVGKGRTQRWVARPPEGFATSLLLVVRGAKR